MKEDLNCGNYTLARNNVVASLLCVGVVLYMGLRPISGYYFGDMGMYAHTFRKIQSGVGIDMLSVRDAGTGDAIFMKYVELCSFVMDVHTWFLLDAFIYVGCLYVACKRIFPNDVYIAFLMCITAFSFWSYGINGIRNGMATSILVLAFSFVKEKKMSNIIICLCLCFCAAGTHKAVTLPVLAGCMAYYYNNTRMYLWLWGGCIVLSVLFTGFWENFFANLGFGGDDKRVSGYLTSNANAHQFSSTGFRWDFLIYSAVPIVMGFYTIFKKNQYDKLYLFLLNTYIISNAFWILVIRANFSNRFAYLSWFLYPIILIYPMLKFKIWEKQYSVIGLTVLLHFMFTYIMWLIKG
jgi:hypothetical protein